MDYHVIIKNGKSQKYKIINKQIKTISIKDSKYMYTIKFLCLLIKDLFLFFVYIYILIKSFLLSIYIYIIIIIIIMLKYLSFKNFYNILGFVFVITIIIIILILYIYICLICYIYVKLKKIL